MSLALAVVQTEWTQEQKDLIKKTVAQDASDAELLMFLHIASKAGLDPLQKQIHFTKRQGRVTVIAGIDGLQARAAREPDYEGILSGVVCAKDDFEFDAPSGKVSKHTYNAFGDRGPIKGAWATVQRKGKLPFTAIVRFEEFNQPNSPTWKQMPSVMIQKVAKSTALRMAYPEQFSAVYEGAEMDQSGVSVKDVTPAESKPASGPDAARAALGLGKLVVEHAKVESGVVQSKPVIIDVKPGETEAAAEKRISTMPYYGDKSMEQLEDLRGEVWAWLEKQPSTHPLRAAAQAKFDAIVGEIEVRKQEVERAQ